MDEAVDTHELKRGISLIMDHMSLGTPPVMVHIVRMVCVRYMLYFVILCFCLLLADEGCLFIRDFCNGEHEREYDAV